MENKKGRENLTNLYLVACLVSIDIEGKWSGFQYRPSSDSTAIVFHICYTPCVSTALSFLPTDLLPRKVFLRHVFIDWHIVAISRFKDWVSFSLTADLRRGAIEQSAAQDNLQKEVIRIPFAGKVPEQRVSK